MNPIRMDNEEKLLGEIRENNCREILACEVTIQVAENRKSSHPNEMAQMEQVIAAHTKRRDGLMEAIEVIDRRVHALQSER